MKNMMKNTICALTVGAVCLTGAATASASGHDVQDFYVCDADTLVLFDQASYDSYITFEGLGFGTELHVMEYQNGFGYCYVPEYDVNGWVDMVDVSYVDTVNMAEYVDEDDCVEIRYSNVASGYLALRTAPANNDANITARIYENGTALWMTGDYNGDYGYCYVPVFDMYGWVNVNYTR